MNHATLRRALLALVVVATSARAWGPYSHVILNQQAVPRLRDTPGLELLKEARYAVLFARAGAAADLVFSVQSGGKTDPAMNAVLHDPGFHAELYHRCRQAEDKKCQAFALGLAGHAAADRAGNGPDADSAANLFGWSTTQDVFGDPVASPEESAAAQLRTVTIGVNKILIDGLLRRHRVRWRLYSPFVEEGALTEALQVYQGPNSLPNDTDQERDAIAEDVGEHKRRFLLAYTVLRVLGRRVHDNERIGDPLTEVYGAEVDQLPAIRASVDEIVAAVSRLVSGAPGPVGSMAELAEGPEAHCHDLTGSMEGLAEAAQSRTSPRLGVFGGAQPGEAEQPDDREASSEPAPPLPAQGAGAGSPEADQALGELRKKVMTEVGKNLMVPRRSWGRLRRNVRRLVPVERSEREGAGTAEEEELLPATGGAAGEGEGHLFGLR